MVRDMAVRELLASEGWRIAIVWECALRRSDSVLKTASMLAGWLRSNVALIEIEASPDHEIVAQQ